MRNVFIIISAVLLFALVPSRVQAHAALIESSPAANAVLMEAPQTARIRYTEPLEPSYSRMALLNTDGEQISEVPSRIDPGDVNAMLLDLPVLPEGRYVLQWRALSTADGHTSQGTVSFAIGDPAAANAPLILPPPPPNPLALPSPIEVVLRWLTVIGLAVVMGSLVFGTFVWQMDSLVDPETDAAFDSRAYHLERVAAVVAALASIGMLIVASTTAQADPLSFITSSRVGAILALRSALLLGLLGVVWFVPAFYQRPIGMMVGALGLLSLSLLSHSAVPQGQGGSATMITLLIALGFDWLHLLATVAWIGGLVPLLLALQTLRREAPTRRTQAATVLVARFTALATAAVIVLSATGSYAAFQHVGHPSELWTTTYGRALTLKLALFGLLLLLGGYNRWWVHPRLATLTSADADQRSQHLLQRLRRSIALEFGASGVLLLTVGVLTAVAPAREAGRGPGYTESAQVGAVRLQLQVVPGGVAGDVFAMDVGGLPPTAQPEVVLRGAMTTHHAGDQELQLVEVETGRWGARGTLLAMTGQWDVEAIVRSEGMEDVRHTFTVDTTTPELAGTATPALRLWVLLFIGAVLVAALSQLPASVRWRFRLQTSSLVLVLGAFVASLVPYYAARATEPTNPLAETPAVLASGKTIYQQNCVTCHGISGRGDGPAAQALPGLPGDFTQPHFATHTDGQVYGWIKGGKPGTAMPAFGEQLSEEQVWQVVSYIRSIYRDAQE